MSRTAENERLFTGLLRFGRSLRLISDGVDIPADVRVSKVELGVLARLQEAGCCRASGLGDDLHLGRPAVSRHVAALAARGLILRDPDPRDGRAELLTLTPAGEQALAAARSAYVDRLADLLDDWDPALLGQFADQVHTLCDSLSTSRTSEEHLVRH